MQCKQTRHAIAIEGVVRSRSRRSGSGVTRQDVHSASTLIEQNCTEVVSRV